LKFINFCLELRFKLLTLIDITTTYFRDLEILTFILEI
jgi:hypothetical protein